ncbi:MAG: FecR domain-containing protein [Opitutaceae bacterium]|nr:FecR domain-containing protein [Opitutaceae bacterium]
MATGGHQRPGASEAIEAIAAAWLARRDRGFTADDNAEFALWRFSAPRHAAAVDRLEKAWGSLDALRDFRPLAHAHPDPDLLASRRKPHTPLQRSLSAAALVVVAASLAVAVWVGRTPTEALPSARQAILHPGPERLVLDDGSIIELNAGAKTEVSFTPAERRVFLLGGEALFTVAKNPEWPFIVNAGDVAVRAIGTAFSVARGDSDVSLLVTEGIVGLEQLRGKADATSGVAEFAQLHAGQRAVYMAADKASGRQAGVEVSEVTPAEVEQALAWQRMRLEFVELPLANVVAEFNRYNRQRLVVADRDTGAVLIGGNFRTDNVEGFVRLLESGFSITSSRRGDVIVLRKAR